MTNMFNIIDKLVHTGRRFVSFLKPTSFKSPSAEFRANGNVFAIT